MEAHPARTFGEEARKRERVRCSSLVDWPVYPRFLDYGVSVLARNLYMQIAQRVLMRGARGKAVGAHRVSGQRLG